MVRFLCLWLLLTAGVVAAAPKPATPEEPVRLQARVAGSGSPVVLLGGGLLGADGWGAFPR